MSTDRLVIRNESDVPRVTEWVHAWAREQALSADTTHRLDVCTNELLTNVMSHGFYDDFRDGHRVTLTLRREADSLSLEIEDDGKPFNPLESVPPDPGTSIKEAPVGGWGLPIVRRFSDALHYERTDGRNRVTVTHRCPPATNNQEEGTQ